MKKLLAVVLSAAMVLGMSTVAMAEDVKIDPTFEVEGNTLYVNVEGTWNVVDSKVTLAEDAEVVKFDTHQDLKMAIALAPESVSGSPACNVADGEFLFAAALTTNSGAGLEFTGKAFYIEFAAPTTVTTADGTVIEIGGEDVPTPTEEPDPTDAPVDPTEEPKEDATKAPAADDKAEATKAPAATTNKTEAAKTADVAPVATMAVLALAAAAVVVAMKKRVTE